MLPERDLEEVIVVEKKCVFRTSIIDDSRSCSDFARLPPIISKKYGKNQQKTMRHNEKKSKIRTRIASRARRVQVG